MPDETEQGQEDIDLASAFGAEDVSAQCFSIYIPNKDRNGDEIGNQRRWVLEAIRLLSQINGGCTAMPPVEGGWLNDEGKIVWECPVVIYSFIRPEAILAEYPLNREFLHRMGRETNQGEVAFEFDSRFYKIRTFDPLYGENYDESYSCHRANTPSYSRYRGSPAASRSQRSGGEAWRRCVFSTARTVSGANHPFRGSGGVDQSASVQRRTPRPRPGPTVELRSH
ncbi:MAG TPA: hypothetical protein VFJ58_30070 [Armatimonadota bacterium]|nr:hypothetical protein [Armatimonadota bacterium]